MIDPQLTAALASAQDSERRFAAQEIGESGDPEAVGALLSRLQEEPSRVVKEAILRSLSRIWGSSPADSIVELLRDHDPFVRAEAADMLRRRAGDAIEPLNRLMRGGDKDLRKFSIDILSQTSVGIDDALYMAALQDDDINVVISAIENIGTGRRVAYTQAVVDIALQTKQPMAICACLESLALIGSHETLLALRPKFPAAAHVSGLYLQPFLKLLGGTGGPEAIPEICEAIRRKGAEVHEVAIDAVSKIVARHALAQLDVLTEELLCGLLSAPLEPGVGFHLLRLLGHFTASSRVALAVLPFIHHPGLGLTAVESLGRSPDPGVEAALQALLLAESDPEIQEELEDILRRRPRWNSAPNNIPS